MPARIAAAIALSFAAAACAEGPPVVPWEVPAEPGVRVETWAEGLEHPFGIAFLPDGRALVTERPGRLRILGRDGRVGPPVAGVPDVGAFGQGGLLDVAVHPEFAGNGLVYLSHSSGTEKANHTALTRAKLSGNMLSEQQELLRNPTAKQDGQHFGSRLLWLPDNLLLMSVGDGGNPPVALDGENIRNQAQNPRAWFGKTLRITADGEAAPDNPGAKDPKLGWDARLWTMGHRNIQGLARDPATGTIWSSEHGARGGDELNRMVAGGNYGWPLVTYSVEYSGQPISSERTREGLRDPVSVWTPSIAASGLAVYRGKALPTLEGAILAGGLASGDVRVIRLAADGTPASETRITIGARVRDVRTGPDGLVYILTDEAEGRILRLRAE